MYEWEITRIERAPKVSAQLQVTEKFHVHVDESYAGGYRAFVMFHGTGIVSFQVIAQSPSYPTIAEARAAAIELAEETCEQFAHAADMLNSIAETCA